MGQMMPLNSPTPAAMASRASTATQGLPAPWASPLAVLTPMRTPVKEPGPVTTAMRSMSCTVSPVAAKAASTMGIRLVEWVSLFTAAHS